MHQKLLLVAIVLILTVSLTRSKTYPKSIRATIMHHNAKGSPIRNHTASEDEVREKDFEISRSRAEYYFLQTSMQNANINSIKDMKSIKADVEIRQAPRSSFIMKFSIGTPPISTYGYVDTGSGLSWVQCAPCVRCYEQMGAIKYNMNDSSSFDFIREIDPLCSSERAGATVTMSGGKCLFQLQYLDKSTASGVLGTETFGFNYDVYDIVFGCSYNNNRKDFSPPALIGLGNTSSSIVRQLMFHHFYYFIHYSETSDDMVGIIDIGSPPTDPPENPIPIISSSSDIYYRLGFQSIFVNEVSLNSHFGGLVIDTGSQYTLLPEKAYEELKTAIINVMGDPIATGFTGKFCYYDVLMSPQVVFYFQGYYHDVCTANLWYKNVWGRYCLAIEKGPDRLSHPVFGMYQQRGMNVSFNLEKGYVTIDPVDHQCQKME